MSKDFRFDKYDYEDQFETSNRHSRRAQRDYRNKGQKKRHAGHRHADKVRDPWSLEADNWAQA